MNRALILTAKRAETDAVREQLIGPIRTERTPRGNRYGIYSLRSSVDAGTAVQGIEVALYETGRGQTPSIMHTGHLAESFRPDLAIYIGCAGGDPHDTEVGDVVIATEIWNYERASTQGSMKLHMKGHPLEPDRVLVDECKSIDQFGTWRHRMPGGAKNDVSVHFEPVASGEKVIKSERSLVWRAIKGSLSDEIIACETEGHGFLAALAPLKTFGIMIRGISDRFDDKGATGKAADDRSQSASTSHAAAFAAQLLEEVSYDALRATKGIAATRPAPEPELVSLEIVLDISQLSMAMSTLMKVVGADKVTVRKVDEGSIIVVAEMEPKPAALAGALFEGGYLTRLLGYPVRQCVASIRTTGDGEFDGWLESVRHRNIAAGWEILRSKSNVRWRNLSDEHLKELKRWDQHNRRVRTRRFVASKILTDIIRSRAGGVTQTSIARLAGYSRATISRILARMPTRELTARRIYEALRELLRGDLPEFEKLFIPAE